MTIEINKHERIDISDGGVAKFNNEVWELEAEVRVMTASLRGNTSDMLRVVKARNILRIVEKLCDTAIMLRLRHSDTMNQYIRAESELSCLHDEIGRLGGSIKARPEIFIVYEEMPDGTIEKTKRISMYQSGGMIDGEPCVSFKSAAGLASHVRRFDCEIKMIDGIQSIIYPVNAFGWKYEEKNNPFSKD